MLGVRQVGCKIRHLVIRVKLWLSRGSFRGGSIWAFSLVIQCFDSLVVDIFDSLNSIVVAVSLALHFLDEASDALPGFGYLVGVSRGRFQGRGVKFFSLRGVVAITGLDSGGKVGLEACISKNVTLLGAVHHGALDLSKLL